MGFKLTFGNLLD